MEYQFFVTVSVFIDPTSHILLLLSVLHQLGVHVSYHIEQRLHRRVIGNATASLGVALHSVHKYLQAAM